MIRIFETTGAGVSVTGDLNVSGISSFSGNVSFGSTATFGDDDQIIMGDGSDLKIYHDESNSYITDSGSGNLLIGSDNDLWITNAAGKMKNPNVIGLPRMVVSIFTTTTPIIGQEI